MLKKAVELVVKEKYSLNPDKIKAVWASSDENIVKVDDSGCAEGVSAGEAVVFAEYDGKKDECTLYVVEKEYGFDDNIMISVFWPPTKDLVNDEQYKYMADAGITWIGYGDLLGDKETQLKMLELSYKYGMHMMVNDSRLGGNLLNLSSEQIKALVEEYKNIPGANGYYVLDEPLNPNVFINAYKALKEADPSAYMHLNFFPFGVYPSIETYISQMNDWVKLSEVIGYPQDYLMFDMYPFGVEPDSFACAAFLKNCEAARKVGVANNVKTAAYIQSVCIPGHFRSLNYEETLYEANLLLAFGIKQISYFTWFTPHERSEPFEDGIISVEGVPNPKYEFICKINKMIAAVGKTLVNCEAYEVYTNKEYAESTVPTIPEKFFVHSGSAEDDFTVSFMADKKSGRNYCMIVNNSFTKEAEYELTFDKEINSLQYLSGEDGRLYPLETDGNKLNLKLGKGEAVIIALPEGYRYKGADKPRYDDLARYAEIYCTSSEGSEGWYMDKLNDGNRQSKEHSNGWKSKSEDGLDEILIDLKEQRTFDRIDLYPAGAGEDYGKDMPKAFVVSVSDDKKNYSKILEVKDLEIKGNDVPSYKFGKVTGRYVKINITETRNKVSAICEIEIYNGK